jgi:hypothetical protein
MLDLGRQIEAEVIFAADGVAAMGQLVAWGFPMLSTRPVQSKGYLESVLDEAVDFCSRDYVLRLDDDEGCSKALVRWLTNRGYESGNHWRFDRVHLWGDVRTALVTPQLYPDHQTRLSVKRLAGGRPGIHSGSPHGGGLSAPCSLEHHKFLVKSLEERREIVRRYDQVSPGAGTSFAAFSVPEDVYAPDVFATHLADWDGERLNRRAA